jgi:hypothetical protein
MGRRFARAILAAAAAGTTVAVFGLTAAGTAGAATRPTPQARHLAAAAAAATATGRAPVVATNNTFAGYGTALADNWRFRSVATTVPVAACAIAPAKNPVGLVQLVGGVSTTWDAEIAVFCNGGVGSIVFFDQKSASTTAQGAFVLSPRPGDRLRIGIGRNVAGHQDSFGVTNLRTGRSQTVRVTTSTAVVYRHAFLGAVVVNSNADLTPRPATRKLLWAFGASRVVTYGGVRGTLLGPWSTVELVDRVGAVTFMFPSALGAGGSSFSTFLHAAS